MFVTTLALVFEMVAEHVREAQAPSRKARAERKVVARSQGGIVGVAGALLAVCCLLSAAFAVQPGFDAREAVRQVRSVARPASGIEQGLDDGEFLLDKSITVVPAYYSQYQPAVASDGTDYLVVWHDWRDGDNECDIYGARESPSGMLLDPAGIPICTTSGYQAQPAVAFDGANYLVVWTDCRSGYDSEDIYGARVSPSGAVLDPDGIPISTAASGQEYPALSSDGTDFLVVWADSRDSGLDDLRIYGARVTWSGIVLDPDGFPIPSADGHRDAPAVSFDGTNYLVAWTDTIGSGFDVYGARVSQSGTVLDSLGFAISAATDDQASPAVSFDGTNYLVAWRDGHGYDVGVRGARVTPQGVVLDTAGLVISDSLGGEPAIAFDGDNFLVSWGAYGARVTPAGVVLDTAGIVISASGGESPALASDGVNYLAVWENWHGYADVYGARVSKAGAVLDTERLAVATSAQWQWSPAVSFDGTNFLAVWEDYRDDPDTPHIYGTRVSQSGAVLDPQGFAISTAAGLQLSPAVSFDGTNYLVVWVDGRNEWYGDVYGARVSPLGVVLDPQGIAICTARGFQWSPAVSSDGTNFLVVWEDARDGGDIYGARVTSAGEVLDPDGTPISTADREQFGADVSFDGTDFLVVWGDNRRQTQTDIYGARVSPSGAVIDTAGILNSATSRWLWSPVLSFDGTNHMVVWAGSDNRFDTIYDIHGARVNPAGVVLDSIGFTLATAEFPRPYPAVAFDGTNHLLMWERERNVSPCIYGERVTTQGIPFDSGTVVTGLHGSGSAELTWPALLILTHGTGGLLFLAYVSRAGTVDGKAYNAQRIWGKMNPAPGIEQEQTIEVRRAIGGATIVRGVLFLPEASSPKPQAACLLDVSGRKVLDLRPGANDVSRLAPGVYFLRETSGVKRAASSVRKVVVQR